MIWNGINSYPLHNTNDNKAGRGTLSSMQFFAYLAKLPLGSSAERHRG
jgi:hypothetical protein